MVYPVFHRIKRLEKDGSFLEYGVAGPADAPVLLLLHAIRNTKMLFAGIVPELAQRYRVIAVDLRGHGNSAKDEPYSFEAIVDDLVGLLDAEEADRVTVAAASFSAVPAQMLAVREPRRITGLILMDGGFYRLSDMPGFDLATVVERLVTTRFPSVEEAERQFADRYGEGNLPRGWMEDELEQKEDGGYGYRLSEQAFSAYFHAYETYDKERLFGQLSCPVLLLVADENRLPDDEQRTFYHDALASYREAVKWARIKSIPDSLHLLMVTNPRDTVEEIKDFIQEMASE